MYNPTLGLPVSFGTNNNNWPVAKKKEEITIRCFLPVRDEKIADGAGIMNE